ncbi:replication endonuclease [Vogesella sp. EB]|uniref:replication endonuclease n=1 Tax=Vogesella sp. EB TaxID=1526735 RepID=UPI00069D0BF1|nr:replication endonuclease [Vogesella sp. EB]
MDAAQQEKRRLASLPVAKWVEEQVSQLPRHLARAVKGEHARRCRRGRQRDANLWLLRLAASLPDIDLTASDADLCRDAQEIASDIERYRHEGAGDVAGLVARCVTWGVPVPGGEHEAGMWARAQDARHWRRHLRRRQGVAIERLARAVGIVNDKRNRYCSNDSLSRFHHSRRRNALLLESMRAENELGQSYTLAELAQVSVSNPEIRRTELMVRVAGFDLIAQGLGHAAEFVTITCPSRFHAVTKSGHANTKYSQELTPDEAQQYLCEVWASIRSALERRGVRLYGFRVVEPHHDGTPHWHALIFMDQRHVDVVRATIARYAVRMDRDELGLAYQHLTKTAAMKEARQRREDGEVGTLKQIAERLGYEAATWGNPTAALFEQIKARVYFEPIDRSRGTAAGYIAKYISKNIDGKNAHGDSIGDDLEAGEETDARDSAQRVGAWASVWRKRQFQQIGGAPVTIWRELRRWSAGEVDEAEQLGAALWRELRGLPPAEPSVLEAAAAAADAGHWNTFVRLMGGETAKRRDMPLSLWHESTEPGTVNRYGECVPTKLRGVVEGETGQYAVSRVHEWTILRAGEAGTPRSPVNNCTESADTAEFKPVFQPEWLEWLDSINSGQPLNMPEEVREALEENFFPDWCGEDDLPSWLGAHDQPAHLKADAVPRYREAVQRKAETRRAIDDAGGVAQYIQQVQDAATMARRISWALVKGRQHVAVAGWHQQGIARINHGKGTTETEGLGSSIARGKHDQRTGEGKGLCPPDRQHGRGAGREDRHAGSSLGGAGGLEERARAWLKATC